jgi:NAD(P)-dependent dehydrogenase (short-subunit alcohol dehydrogenase family)
MAAIAIFGGSGGLGAAVARRLGREHPVVLGFRSNRDKADAVVAELARDGQRALAVAVDTGDAASVEAFLGRAAEFGGGLRGVVSAIGAPFPMCALTDGTEAEFRDVMETEVFGTFRILRATVPRLKAAGGGSILLFLTTAVLRTMDFDGFNSVPKAAIGMMIRHVAREAGADNVRINGIAPGVIDAGRTLDVSTLPPLIQQVVADAVRDTPLPRLGRPEEVGALASFLMSDGGAYVNGQIIGVDGGYSA